MCASIIAVTKAQVVPVTVVTACTAGAGTYCDNTNSCVSRKKIVSIINESSLHWKIICLFCFNQNCYAAGIGITQDCPEAAPYCVSNNVTAVDAGVTKKLGACTATKPLKSKLTLAADDDCTDAQTAITSPFICTKSGFMPDPTDCRKYYFCNILVADAAPTATPYTCQPGYAYNPLTTMCDTRYIASRCLNVGCNATEGNSQKAFGVNSKFYIICVAGPTKPVAHLFTCPMNTIANVRTSPVACNYQCRRNGFFANSETPNAYFECFYAGGWRSTERNCPTSTKFVENVLIPTRFECRG